MHSWTANGDSRLLFWQRVREFAVPPPMIESATSRRAAGDWAGACAAARVDVDLNLRAEARVRGREFAARVRSDLRHLAPDLLRWHFPRIAPDGLLRPGLTVCLAQYFPSGPGGGTPVHLVARTPPAWADAGQRISLALWDGPGSGGVHPHPRPDRRFRLDLHRHLWDARRAGELRERSGPDRQPGAYQIPEDMLPPDGACAVDRWADEAAILLRAEGWADGTLTVRLGARRHLMLDLGPHRETADLPPLRITAAPANGDVSAWPILPDAATWVPPDLELLREGLIDADHVHPLVAAALVPDYQPSVLPRNPLPGNGSRFVECCGDRHRIGLVDGVLVPLDHDPAELRREELLAALGGTPMPCLQAIDEAHRHPECLVDVRARLDHGDAAGALTAVENLLGPDVLLRSGALRDELEAAVQRKISHGLYRAGLTGRGPVAETTDQRRKLLFNPHHASH